MKQSFLQRLIPYCLSVREPFLITTVLLFAFMFGAQNIFSKPASLYPRTFRIGSYNIRHGAGLDDKMDLSRQVKVLREMNADVVALQEVDMKTERIGGRDEIDELSRELLMYPTYGAAIDFQGGQYGVGILSKDKPLDVKRIPLPGTEEARVLLVAEFDEYVFACTHLSLTDADRMSSVALINNVASSYGAKPFFIAGDWNDYPDSDFIAEMEKTFMICTRKDKNTFPADKPDRCIDYIAVYKGAKAGLPTRIGYSNDEFASQRPYINEPAVVNNAVVVDEPIASDHRPVMVDVVLPTAPDKLMTTQPYLQNPKPDEMTVMFQTNSVSHCWIEYGVDSLHTSVARTLLDGQEVCYNNDNSIKLTNLKPAERYYYRVCAVELLKKRAYENHFGDTLRTRFFSFVTPKADNDSFSCLIFNDLHSNKDCFNGLLSLVKDVSYDFVVFNGDCLAEPTDREHAVEMIHELTDKVDGAEHPVVFIRGNHEIRGNYSAGMHHLLGYPDNKTYGTFCWGDTRFMILDCGEDKPDSVYVYAGLNDFDQLRADQLDYIRKELKNPDFKNASRRVLISHIPVFGDVDKYRPCNALWGKELGNAPFDIAIGAHNHAPAYYSKGVDGCRFPVQIGGGPTLSKATLILLEKNGSDFSMRVLSKSPQYSHEVKF